MVTFCQMIAHFKKLFSNEHYIVQFLAKLLASTANIKGMGILQTFGQSQNEIKF